jgi:hypothetical protein
MERCKVGVTYGFGLVGTYIQDHPFYHVAEIPVEVAVAWVNSVCPNVNMGNSRLASELTPENATTYGWLNKLFVIVGESHGKWMALNNHDGSFSIYMER